MSLHLITPTTPEAIAAHAELNDICTLLFGGQRLRDPQIALALKVIDTQEPSDISKTLKRKISGRRPLDEYEAHCFEELFATDYVASLG